MELNEAETILRTVILDMDKHFYAFDIFTYLTHHEEKWPEFEAFFCKIRNGVDDLRKFIGRELMVKPWRDAFCKGLEHIRDRAEEYNSSFDRYAGDHVLHSGTFKKETVLMDGIIQAINSALICSGYAKIPNIGYGKPVKIEDAHTIVPGYAKTPRKSSKKPQESKQKEEKSLLDYLDGENKEKRIAKAKNVKLKKSKAQRLRDIIGILYPNGSPEDWPPFSLFIKEFPERISSSEWYRITNVLRPTNKHEKFK